MPFELLLDEPTEPLQPVCRHLRSKAIYVAGQMEPPAEMQQSGSGHCWCNLTQHVQGPDNGLVDRRGCNGDRPCYERVL